jgi:hypothetical protein
MITPADFMRFPPEDRAVALDTFREHLGRLLLAEAAMVLRERLPGAASIGVRFPNSRGSWISGRVDLLSVCDANGRSLGSVGIKAALQATALLCDVQRVYPGLLGRPDPDSSSVARVDLPAVPDDV